MDTAPLIVEKLAFLLILVGAGVVAKRAGWLAVKTQEDLGTLVNNLFWPCLAFSSITTRLGAADVLPNLLLPVLAAYMIAVGLGIGWLVVRWRRFEGDRRKVFLFHAAFNNAGTLGLPLVAAFLPEKGPGMLFIANFGFTVLMWTLGVALFQGRLSRRDVVRQLLSPALVTTLVSLALVVSGTARFVPPLVQEAAASLGAPSVPVGLLLIGAQVHDLGRRALRPDRWNLQLSLVRLVLVPLVMIATAFAGRAWLGWSPDLVLVFVILSLMPASLTSVTLALVHRTGPDLAAQSVLITHILSIATITGFLLVFVPLLTR